MDTDENKGQVNKHLTDSNNRITITTLAALEERDRELTFNMTYDQRMEYLQKLRRITYSDEAIIELEKKFNDGRMNIKKPE